MDKAKGLGFWAMPTAIFIFIIPQSAITAFIFDDFLALHLLIIAAVSSVFYVLAGGVTYALFDTRQLVIEGARSWLFHFLIFLYIGCYLVLYVKGGIPLVELVTIGGDAGGLRAEFTKNQEGGWKVFVYIISILTKGFIPICAVVLYTIKTRTIFYIYLAALTFVTISTLEKTLLIWVYLPLLIYLWSKKRRAELALLSLVVVVCFSVVSIVALKSELSSQEMVQSEQGQYGPSSLTQKVFYFEAEAINNVSAAAPYQASLPDQVERYQFLLYDTSSPNIILYLVNRLLWIPFVTVYDTVLYWQEEYPGLILFSINRHLSSLLGYEFSNLEKNVFRFQFGSGEDTAGNANAFFIAEAYVGFGLVGVILFSMLVGSVFGSICKMNMSPFICALPVVAVGLISSSLISTLFSGGLAFFYCVFISVQQAILCASYQDLIEDTYLYGN